jgi:phosphate transport system permease protein
MQEGSPKKQASAAAATKRAKRLDRFMAWLISAGGALIIAAVLGIMVFITVEALPLFRGTKVREMPAGPIPAVDALFIDESGTAAAIFGRAEGFMCVPLGRDQAAPVDQGALGLEGAGGAGEAREARGTKSSNAKNAKDSGDHAPALPWRKVFFSSAKGRAVVQAADGRTFAAEIRWTQGNGGGDSGESADPTELTGPTGSVRPVAHVDWLGPFLTKPSDALVAARAIRGGGLMGGWSLKVAAVADGAMMVAEAEPGVPILWTTCPLPPSASLGTLAVPYPQLGTLAVPYPRSSAAEWSEDGSWLFVGTDDGRLLAIAPGTEPLSADFGEPVTALGFALGHSSLLVGGENGRLAAYQVLRREGKSELQRFHDFGPLDGSVRGFMESLRDKRFLAYSDTGFAIDHLTTEARLACVSAEMGGAAASMSPKGDYVLAPGAPGENARMWHVRASHPEVSWGLFWKKIHYEGYSKPEHVWQSSGASDDIEPKFSLVPLLFGTIKGTLYAMLFALPIAVLAALYTSQFASAKFRETIKPTVEIMAALPSVVLGFIAGLVLAPMLEEWMMALLAFVPTAAAITVLLMLAWSKMSKSFRDRYGNGREALWLVPVIVLALAASSWMAPLVEKAFFGGDYRDWLYTGHGIMFDQRNSIVVGFAMGFAVIPIIFSISEDAFTAVPKSLASASLACGASPWQTAWRVILPTASPGVFSAVMVGLGRAIGETMIVLMATGNTPLMDWGPFNGMRTLSANIAVEIPEAPHRGTLYRILFFTALLLFALTFVLNTAAELIRQRLRKRYESM